MSFLELFIILGGAVILAWFMISRRGTDVRRTGVKSGWNLIILSIGVLLLIGLMVQILMGNSAILFMVLLAVVITGIVEVTRLF